MTDPRCVACGRLLAHEVEGRAVIKCGKHGCGKMNVIEPIKWRVRLAETE